MDKLVFTISFMYEIIPNSLQVDLCAEIEMTTRQAVIVRSIRRINSTESSLLPLLNLTNVGDKWIHTDSGKESNIGTVIGQAIDRYLKQYREKDDIRKFYKGS